VVEQGGEGAATNEFLLINVRNKPLSDVRVRQALAHAIDREQIVQKSLFGEGKVAHSFVNSGLGWIFEPAPDVYRKVDTDAANRLLDEAGYPKQADGTRFPLRIALATGREYEGRAAEIIKDNLAQVGIPVTIEASDRTSYIDKVFKQWDFDLAHQLFTTGPDPTISVTPRYHTKQIKPIGFVNGMGYSNPALDKIFDDETGLTDRKKRAEMWREAQRILFADLPALPLFEVPVVNLVSAKFHDVITTPYGYIQSREFAWME
jgi:peptide/nickel transport system substrate-binding protein